MMVRKHLLLSEFDVFLSQFDGKSTSLLDQVAKDHPADRSLLLHLGHLAESADPPVQIAASALLKRYLAAGSAFPPSLVKRLLALLSAPVPWESKLHVLQMLPDLRIASRDANPLFKSLCGLLADRNKFVRAWTYNGLHHVARLYPEYHPEVGGLLTRASREEAPSVRARLRQLPPLPPVVAKNLIRQRKTPGKRRKTGE